MRKKNEVINLKLILSTPDGKKESYYNMDVDGNTDVTLKRFGLSLNNCASLEEQYNVISSLQLRGGRSSNAVMIVVYDNDDKEYLKFYKNNYNKRTGNYARGKMLKTVELK